MKTNAKTCATVLLGSLLLGLSGAHAASDTVGPVPDNVRREFKLAPFYQKFIDLDGLPVVGSTNVSDFALREAAWIVRQMLTNRADILHAMASNDVASSSSTLSIRSVTIRFPAVARRSPAIRTPSAK